ncbi:sulfate/molybdate ABC transporter ATP-binding protein [Subtercola lobariae]|uniref:Molybdenum ABC transporter ATP-binding protein n=1 Tax=Subtercola lobariae TaxID=1588641 RepID=A0A917B785_9MICO|nr:ABC transporter ATP-binding protein [Subtercola lobariae]GGF22427.1 molybdenum ABC transporter ATP-binding protein [Subtercola lobariae]
MTFTFEAAVARRKFDVSFSLSQGETLAVLGPNGAGKSTLLNLISGSLSPDSGHAELDGDVLFSAGSGRKRVWQPPHTRGISLLAQQALLFPHLTVLDNVAFGPTSSGVKKRTAHDAARKWLAEVDAAQFERRKPAQLSGGQAQRIAVARALAAEPKLLLLDEPMAALDIDVAPALRRTLRRVLENCTAIIVTHDILDAYTLADRVIVIDNGRIVEDGPTRRVFEQPRDPFTANLAGLNVLSGIRTPLGLRTADGVELAIGAGAAGAVGSECSAAIRPSDVRVSTSPPPDGANALPATITDLEPRGDLVRVRALNFAADLPPALVADLDVSIGTAVWFTFDPGSAIIYSANR